MEVPVYWGSVSEKLDFFVIFKSRLPYQVEKKDVGVPEVGVSEEGVCYKIVFP